MHAATRALIERYYATFNAGDVEGFLGCLTEDVVHHINQGAAEVGLAAFRAFVHRMSRHYREQATDLVIMATPDGARAAAELIIEGEYLVTDEGLPEARGQRYRLPVGAFFEVREGLVTRITNYYNLQDWVAQVAAPDASA